MERPRCIDCGEQAPETNTHDTLISTSLGWRLTRRAMPDGSHVAEWRCADCWRKFRAASTQRRSRPGERPSTPPKGPPRSSTRPGNR